MSREIIVKIVPTNIDGVDYINVNEFALIVELTPSSIYAMAKEDADASSNSLVSKKVCNKVLIAVSELKKFGKEV